MQNIFFLIVGAALLLLGTKSVRLQMRIKYNQGLWEGVILHSEHVEKKDDQGFLVTDYYEYLVQFNEGKGVQKKPIRSGEVFQEGEKLFVMRNPQSNGYIILKDTSSPLIYSVFMLLCGILVLGIPVINLYSDPKYVNILLTLILLLFGILLIALYVIDKRKKLVPISAEITDLVKVTKGQHKKFQSETSSYYPVVTYEYQGKEHRVRLQRNTNSKDNFKVGKKLTVYYNEETGFLEESSAHVAYLVFGVLLLVFGLIGVVSCVQIFLL